MQRALKYLLSEIETSTGRRFEAGLWTDVTFVPADMVFRLGSARRCADLLAGRYHVQVFKTSDVEVDGIVISLGSYLGQVAIARVRAQRASELATEARRLYLEFLIEYLCLEHPELAQKIKELFTVPRKPQAKATSQQPSSFEEIWESFQSIFKS